jgi:ATP-dependent helicase/nuclease subunit A
VDTLPLSHIVLSIFEIFDFYHKISRLKDLDDNIGRLDYLLNFSKTLENNYSMMEFVELINQAFDSGLSLDQKNLLSQDNCVTLINTHKSKGLEYGVCYYPLFEKNIFTQQGGDFIYHEKYGLCIPPTSKYKNDGVIKNFINAQIKMESFSEKIRLLYVALTRAKEEIVFVVPGDRIEKHLSSESNYIDLMESKNYLDFVLYSNILDLCEQININGIKLLPTDSKGLQAESVVPIFESIKLPDKTLVSRPSKQSGIINQSAIELGLKLHAYLEVVDFISKDTSMVETDLRDYIDDVLKLDLFSNLPEAGVYKEYEYYDEETSINGIIDLLLVFKNQIYIIDYKTKNIDDLAYNEQLRSYEGYIKKIFNLPVKKYLLSILEKRYIEVI